MAIRLLNNWDTMSRPDSDACLATAGHLTPQTVRNYHDLRPAPPPLLDQMVIDHPLVAFFVLVFVGTWTIHDRVWPLPRGRWVNRDPGPLFTPKTPSPTVRLQTLNFSLFSLVSLLTVRVVKYN